MLESNVEALCEFFYGFDPALAGLRSSTALGDDGKSFWVLRLRTCNHIVAGGIDDSSFDASNAGDYLKAADVNAIFDDSDAVFIDMRNHRECEVGHFENALGTLADAFRGQLSKTVEMIQDHKDRKTAMHCTGDAHCEKASAWMKHNGLSKVWHTEGRIIEYACRAHEQGLPVRFTGKNSVFDGRMGEHVPDDTIAHYHQCGASYDAHINCLNDGCHLLFVQYPSCAEKFIGYCSEACMEEHKLSEEEQRKLRAGRENDNKVFNRSRGQLDIKLGISESEPSEKP